MEVQDARETLASRRPRVLVVDDDPGIRLICATNLRLDGFDVIEAVDGLEGLERAEAEAPDLVLLDVNMPVLDGFGLATALRANQQTRHLPVVFLTGETATGIEARAAEAGAKGFFSKPFDPGEVSRFIGGLLSHLNPAPSPLNAA